MAFSDLFIVSTIWIANAGDSSPFHAPPCLLHSPEYAHILRPIQASKLFAPLVYIRSVPSHSPKTHRKSNPSKGQLAGNRIHRCEIALVLAYSLPRSAASLSHNYIEVYLLQAGISYYMAFRYHIVALVRGNTWRTQLSHGPRQVRPRSVVFCPLPLPGKRSRSNEHSDISGDGTNSEFPFYKRRGHIEHRPPTCPQHHWEKTTESATVSSLFPHRIMHGT